MKTIKTFYVLLIFAIFSLSIHPDCKAQSDSIYFVGDLHCKYQYQTRLLLFTSDGRRIAVSKQSNVFICPAGFRILDFDLTTEDGNSLLGLLISDDRRTFLEIRELETGHRRLIKNMTLYRPWKILFADADNDSITEVCLSVVKKSPLHPISAKRLFIYDFHHGLQPKWRGSRLSHPFTDFGFIQDNKQTKLVALEVDRQNRPCINSYEWDNFGFTAIATKFNGPLPQADMLNPGYVLRDGEYKRVLFATNRGKALRVIGD